MVFYYTHFNKKTGHCLRCFFECVHGTKVYRCNICLKDVSKAICQHGIIWNQCQLCSNLFKQKGLNSECVLLRPKTEPPTPESSSANNAVTKSPNSEEKTTSASEVNMDLDN